MKNEIIKNLPGDFPWNDRIFWYPVIDSTNTRAMAMAREGAPEGTTVIAGAQTGGRGRMGRHFSSPPQMGVYLSCILRPHCPPQSLMHLTCAAAVSMMKAVEDACGLRPDIKWINDLVVGKHKLGGILTELLLEPGTGLIEGAIVGIGINCLQKPEDFPEEIRDMATSVLIETGIPLSPAVLAAAMTCRLHEMSQGLLTDRSKIMKDYSAHCMTLGKEIQVIRPDSIQAGTALEVEEDGSLLVSYPDGSRQLVSSGEVSIRGMYGYL